MAPDTRFIAAQANKVPRGIYREGNNPSRNQLHLADKYDIR